MQTTITALFIYKLVRTTHMMSTFEHTNRVY